MITDQRKTWLMMRNKDISNQINVISWSDGMGWQQWHFPKTWCHISDIGCKKIYVFTLENIMLSLQMHVRYTHYHLNSLALHAYISLITSKVSHVFDNDSVLNDNKSPPLLIMILRFINPHDIIKPHWTNRDHHMAQCPYILQTETYTIPQIMFCCNKSWWCII